MIQLHTEFLVKHGKREFAVLPYEEYESLLALLEDLKDLRELRAAKQAEGNAPVLSLEEVKKQFQAFPAGG
jgi:hypothetical protein